MMGGEERWFKRWLSASDPLVILAGCAKVTVKGARKKPTN